MTFERNQNEMASYTVGIYILSTERMQKRSPSHFFCAKETGNPRFSLLECWERKNRWLFPTERAIRKDALPMFRFPPQISPTRCGFLFRRAKRRSVLLLLLLVSVLFFSSISQAHASGGGNTLPIPDASFVHTASSANTHGDYTLLNDSAALPFNQHAFGAPTVTANWNPGGAYTGFDNHQVGVIWMGNAQNGYSWAIINEDQASMPIGASFNVYMHGAGSSSDWLGGETYTTSNSSYITTINNVATNAKPSARVLVTQNMYAADSQCPAFVYNNHAIGTWFDSLTQRWTIYNEDIQAMPTCADFYYTIPPAGQSLMQVATSANTSGDSTCINNSYQYDNPYAVIFINHTYTSGYFTDVSAVWYNISLNEWCIFDGSFQPMPIGATFTVAISSTVA